MTDADRTPGRRTTEAVNPSPAIGSGRGARARHGRVLFMASRPTGDPHGAWGKGEFVSPALAPVSLDTLHPAVGMPIDPPHTTPALSSRRSPAAGCPVWKCLPLPSP
jgi:hypothetical protein